MINTQVILITGAARRIGRAIAEQLHARGMQIMIHYHHSESEAQKLMAQFNEIRPHSADVIGANLTQRETLKPMIEATMGRWGRLDGLINNASVFFPTPMQEATFRQWDDLFSANLTAPFFLAQAAAPYLKLQRGSIINIADIHGEKPLKNYPIYSITKAGLLMMTRALAKELAPDVRVNAISPGLMCWPEAENLPEVKLQRDILDRIALKRAGSPQDIAQAVEYLLTGGQYVTGQTLTVDGGRMLNL